MNGRRRVGGGVALSAVGGMTHPLMNIHTILPGFQLYPPLLTPTHPVAGHFISSYLKQNGCQMFRPQRGVKIYPCNQDQRGMPGYLMMLHEM